MSFSRAERRKIYDRTTGYCHICGKKLAFENYGTFGPKGAWEIEHSNAKSKGGTNRKNNLYPSCISCNRCKNNNSTRSARSKYSRTKAPLSKIARREAKKNNSIIGGIFGGFFGSIFGPAGIVVGSAIGAHLGYNKIQKKIRSAYNQPINPTAFSHSAFFKLLAWLFRYKYFVKGSSIN